MSRYTVIYDACVLYPAPLRDLLMHLAMTGCFKAHWTDQINNEWIEALIRNQPDRDIKRLHRTRDLMNTAVHDARIEGYESLIQSIELPDQNDRHVVAAAIKGRCDLIVTSNLKDFPKKALELWGIEAQHPDEFIAHLMNLHPEVVTKCVKKQRQNLKKPTKTIEELLDILEAQGLVQTIVQLRKYSDLM